MRRSTMLAGVAVAMGGGSLVAASTGAAQGTAREYVVLYDQSASADAGAKAIEAAGGTIVKVNRKIGVATVRSADAGFAQDATRSKAIEAAVANRSIGRVESAHQIKEDAIETDGGTTGPTGPVPPAPVDGDPLSGVQWDMKAIGATPRGSYAVQPGSHAVRVGILDTGVDGSHPDIAPNFNAELSRNFTTDDPVIDGPCEEDPDHSCKDPANVDEDGHGTHVASTIGSPLNGLGIAGVAPGVELVNIRAGQDSGYFFLQPTVDALTYAGDSGIDVVNMSYYIDPWLFNCASNPADTPEEQLQQRTIIEATQRALDYARNHGVTLISAEGNGNSDLGKPTFDDTSPDYPDAELSPHPRTIDNSCISEPTEGDNVIGVTSVGQSGRKAFYSDYGLEQADVSAPGGDSREYYGSQAYLAQENKILAAFPESLGRTSDTNADGLPDIDANGNTTAPMFVKSCSGDRCGYYQYIQGTSMASPHAVGVAALIVAARGTPDAVHGGLTLAPATVEKVLAETATDKPCPTPATFAYPFDAAGAYTATCEGTPQKNGFFGEGLVNALAAGTTPAGDPPPPPPPGGGGGGGGGGAAVVVPKLDVRFAVGRTTTVKRLMLTAAAGAKVVVTCNGGGCPRGYAQYVVGASGRKNLALRFTGRRLQPGARITITVRTAGLKDRRFVLRVRSARGPLSSRAVR